MNRLQPKVILYLSPTLVLLGCSLVRPSPKPNDEQFLRDQLRIPANAKLLSLSAEPKMAGTFGREGLRIHAVFQLTKADAKSYRSTFRSKDWKPTPISEQVKAFPEGPAEISKITANAEYLCDISHWQAADQLPWVVFTEDKPYQRLGRYRVALLETGNAKLHVVYKAFY